MLDWVRLPSAWIQEGGLAAFRWTRGEGANNAAALLVLLAIAHRAHQETGVSSATYDVLARATGLSRAKLSAGLDVLAKLNLIVREPEGRSTYALTGFNTAFGWSKLPARKLYHDGVMVPFADFNLRKPAELDALKLYLLFIQRRGSDTNMANLSYPKITEYARVDGTRIKRALTLLAVSGLVHAERVPSTESLYGISNGYRIVNLDSHVHMGTRGRTLDGATDIMPQF